MKRHLFAAAAGAAFASGVGAMPSGWQTTHGTVDHSRTSSTSMQINVTTPNAATSYSGGFSIAAPESVNITQVSKASVFLIRDVSGNRTDILGSLKANGHIFLSNTNGVLFGNGAQVEVGSLFATSLTMSDDEFRSGLGTGRFTWSRDGSAGAVVNEGTITALNGYAALAGPQVRNTGLIVASLGTAALAAGDRISLDMVGDGLIKVSVDQAALNASAINSGTIEANGGRVLLTARSANALLDTVISNTGALRATRLAERNGEIVLDTGGTGVADISGVLQADVVRLDAGGLTPIAVNVIPIAVNAESTVTLESAGSGLVVATLGTVSIAELAQIVALETQPAGQARAPGGQIVLSGGTTIGRIGSMQHTIVGTGVSAPRDATLLP